MMIEMTKLNSLLYSQQFRTAVASFIFVSAMFSGNLQAGSLPTVQPLPPLKEVELAEKGGRGRLEISPLPGGAELLTFFLASRASDNTQPPVEIPIFSILRDTLYREEPEYHKYRHLWIYGETKASPWQKVAAAVPFLYMNPLGSNAKPEKNLSPVMDLSTPTNNFSWNLVASGVQKYIIEPQAFLVRGPSQTLFKNGSDNRQRQLQRAVTLLKLAHPENGNYSSPGLPEEVFHRARVKAALHQSFLGGLVSKDSFGRIYNKQVRMEETIRSRNWEILRQRAETEGLYFEPLILPGGTVTHVLLWVAQPDLAESKIKSFSGRFLNVDNPWTDKRLAQWRGPVETWHLDAKGRRVDPHHPEARPTQMIPLALYGLNHPRIPALLIDFRSSLNPRMREVSRRLVEDITNTGLRVSLLGNLYYTIGKSVLGFALQRWGKDLNQPSRWRAQAELKVLLEFNASLSPSLKEVIRKSMNVGSTNPLAATLDANSQVAWHQHEQLLAQLQQPGPWMSRLMKDRQKELATQLHSPFHQTTKTLAAALALGFHKHPSSSPYLLTQQLALIRQQNHHLELLKQAGKRPGPVEVTWNPEQFRKTVETLSSYPGRDREYLARLLNRVASKSGSADLAALCQTTLEKVRNQGEFPSSWQSANLLNAKLNPPWLPGGDSALFPHPRPMNQESGLAEPNLAFLGNIPFLVP
jgi:hypothetical protein